MPCHLSYRTLSQKGDSMKKKLSLIVCLFIFLIMAMGSGSNSKTELDSGNSSTNSEIKKEITVEQQLVLDEKDIKITVTGLELDGWLGPQLKLLIENDSAENITVQSRLSSVNGFMIYSTISEDVAALKKANTNISFEKSYLEKANIDTIASMQFSFHIFNSDTWDSILESEPITVYTSALDYIQEVDDEGSILVDTKDIRIIAQGIDKDDSIFGPSLMLYIENNANLNITIQARDVSVNGFMIDSIMSEDISIGNKSITSLTFMNSDLEENGIENIEEIELSFHIYNYDSYDTYLDTQTVKVEF